MRSTKHPGRIFYLRVLGSASLEGPDGAVSGRAVQPRRLALLALLATAGSAGRSRDKLVGYLWPDTDAAHARRLLSDSLYVLHRALGKTALLASGDEIHLNPSVVHVDVVDLEDAIARKDPPTVVDCYRGPSLDGFHVSGAPDLERWIESERERYAKSYAEALNSLAEECEAKGDFIGAIEWWRRLALHEPYSSHVVIRLVQSLLAAGDKAEALPYARDHGQFLQDELDLEPPQELVELIGEITNNHTWQSGHPPATGPPSDDPPADRPAPAGRSTPNSDPPLGALRSWRLATALAVLAAVVTFAWYGLGDSLFKPAPPPKSVAVLPLLNLSDEPGSDYFSDGITSEIINALQKTGDLEVKSRTSVMSFKNAQEPIRDIGRKLNVAAVLEG